MLNLLKEYIPHSLPEGREFETNPNLTAKVDPEGRLLPFRGNTVVFLLEPPVKRALQELQESLYAAAPEMLAQRLRPESFHMTLHDLANGRPDSPGLADWMAQAGGRAREILARWTGETPLQMRTTWLFNMVNTSIVLGLAPADPESGRRLEEMYGELEEAVRLGYPLTPHITMAYFRPGRYSPEQVGRLAAALRPVEREILLSPAQLVLQTFEDMNHYENS